MRAVVYPADPAAPMRIESRPRAVPGPGEISVRVRAAGLNRADLLQRRGVYAAPAGAPPDIPGLEFAGEVESLGPGAARWRVGDRVMGLVPGGAHAERVVLHEAEAIPVPARFSWQEAAAVPEAFLTAWDALVVRGRAAPGERVLIHAVGSGVGTAAVQLARWLGAVPIGTARTEAKLEAARDLGLAQGINTASVRFAEVIGEPVQVILDLLGAGAFADNLAVLAPRGRLVLFGLLTGRRAEVDLGPVLLKRLEIIGTVIRSRAREERIALAGEFTGRVLPALESGALRPVVYASLPMAAVAEAHRAMESNAGFGKIVLTWD